jgi:hypothetical protein
MAQDRWINITLEPTPAKKNDLSEYRHDKKMGTAASGDLTVSFDMTKFTSIDLFKSAVAHAVIQATGMIKP